jgi:hypothetical protein
LESPLAAPAEESSSLSTCNVSADLRGDDSIGEIAIKGWVARIKYRIEIRKIAQR